jgi:hypothetical protein
MPDAIAPADALARPDAVLIREELKQGSRSIDRITSILDIVEPILGVDRDKGEKAYIRQQHDHWCFVTRDPTDSIWGAHGTPMEGHPRYRWELDPSGTLKRGWLL